MVTLDGFEAKFARAFALAATLEQEISGYLASEPFELVEEVEPGTGHHVVRAHVRAEPPTTWSVLVGDALHNARSALDHLAWQLVEMHGGPPDRSRFPFKESLVGFGEELRKALPRVPSDVRDQVRALQPWRGGDDRLWLLHQLDIIDKHRLLVPVAAANKGVDLHFTLTRPGQESIQMEPLGILSEDGRVPLKDGDEVFRDQAPDQMPADFPLQMRQTPTFHVIFAEGSEVAGEEVGPTVRDLIEHARECVEPLLAIVRQGSARGQT